MNEQHCELDNLKDKFPFLNSHLTEQEYMEIALSIRMNIVTVKSYIRDEKKRYNLPITRDIVSKGLDILSLRGINYSE